MNNGMFRMVLHFIAVSRNHSEAIGMAENALKMLGPLEYEDKYWAAERSMRSLKGQITKLRKQIESKEGKCEQKE